MVPPCRPFSASELPAKIQEDANGRRRKLEAGAKALDLSACELLEMMQYKCDVERPLTKDSKVQCFSVDRLFRRCKDRKSTFLVETTAWEGMDYPSDGSNPAESSKCPASSNLARPYQWSPGFHDSDSPS